MDGALGRKTRRKKQREKEMQMTRDPQYMLDLAQNSSHESSLPRYHSPRGSQEGRPAPPPSQPRQIAPGPYRDDQRSESDELSYKDAAPTPNNHSRSNTYRSNVTQTTTGSKRSKGSRGTVESKPSNASRATRATKDSKGSGSEKTVRGAARAGPSAAAVAAAAAAAAHPVRARPTLYPSDSSSTLVGSGLERKMNDVDSYKGPPDTTERLAALRELMVKDNLDY